MHYRFAFGITAILLTTAVAHAQEGTTPKAVPPPAAGYVLPPLDHRFEGWFGLGLMMPGELTPSNSVPLKTSVAPTFALNASWVAHPFFSLGVYLQLTPQAFERRFNTATYEGQAFWTAAGAVGKVRFQVSKLALLRVGLSAGPNFISLKGDDSSSIRASGSGLNIGLVADAALRLSRKVGATAQLGFLSQVNGSLAVEGADDRDFSFKPIFFLMVGPELYL